MKDVSIIRSIKKEAHLNLLHLASGRYDISEVIKKSIISIECSFTKKKRSSTISLEDAAFLGFRNRFMCEMCHLSFTQLNNFFSWCSRLAICNEVNQFLEGTYGFQWIYCIPWNISRCLSKWPEPGNLHQGHNRQSSTLKSPEPAVSCSKRPNTQM